MRTHQTARLMVFAGRWVSDLVEAESVGPGSAGDEKVQGHAGELDGDAEQLASMALDLFIAGGAWANGLRLDDLGYSTPAENH